MGYSNTNSESSSYEPATLNNNGTADDTTDDYYEIANAGQFYWFAEKVNAGDTAINGKLTADIDINPGYTFAADGTYSGGTSPRAWSPIGAYPKPYTGEFDGAGHTVSGIFISSAAGNVGIFGLSSGTIKNIKIMNSYFSGASNVGSVCGYNKGFISGCYNTGTVNGKNGTIGGICGQFTGGTITNCYNTGIVSGTSNYVGGVCGYVSYSNLLTNCYYLTGCATDGNGVVQNGIGYLVLGSTTADTENCTTAKNTEQFASGEVCYLLNGSTSEGTLTWFQTCGTGTPTFSGETVYKGAYKNGIFDTSLDVYTNTYQEYEAAVLNNNGTTNDDTDDYYEIANAGQLCWFAAKVNAGATAISGKLTADIDLYDVTWSGICNKDTTSFNGIFDGGGFAISNMNSAKTDKSPGLIYALGANGVVKNLTMKSAYTFDQPGQSKGIVVGANSGSIEAVFVTDSQITMGNYIGMGGIAGKNTGTISNCGVVNVTFTRCWSAIDNNRVAGAITETNAGTVSNCYSYDITFTGGTTANAGVLVATGIAPVNSYYLSTDISTEKKVVADGGGTAATAEQFASGKVCWLLNDSTATGVWKQDIDVDDTPDASPNFTGAAVYHVENLSKYSNSAAGEIVSVDITWGAMAFTYSDGTWNTESHEWEGTGWIPDQTNGNAVTVKNIGTVIVNAEVSYMPLF